MMDRDPFKRRMTKRIRGDHNSRPDRCAWIIDIAKACPKLLKKGETGYCPGHKRLFEQMKQDYANFLEAKKKQEQEEKDA